MNRDAEFDLKDFQSTVYKHYKSLMREVETARLISERGYAGFEDDLDSGLIKKTTNRLFR